MNRALLLIFVLLFSCGGKDNQFVIDDAYRAQFPIERLVKDRTGYLQLPGLFPLNPATTLVSL